MWQRIVHFISYHNAIPITLGVLFLGAGTTFAMSPEVRGAAADTVFKAEQKVVSIDNTYIVNKDLDTYTPKVNITNVVEDETHYYVDYTLSTIALEDHVWQDVTQERQMKVVKDALGEYTDLGVYVTEQLKQLVDRELAQLKEVQEIERRQVSNKAVATAYSGLVGQFIDERTEKLPGYTPVVEEQEEEPGEDPVAVAQRKQEEARAARGQNTGSNDTNTSPTSDPAAPVLTPLGANPARIAIGSTYSDLGVTVTTADGRSIDLTVRLSLNGEDVSNIDIDTSEPSEWTVGYRATYEGATGHADRRVVVYDPDAQQDTGTTTPDTSGSQQDDTTQDTSPAGDSNTDESGNDTATSTNGTTDTSSGGSTNDDTGSSTATSTPQDTNADSTTTTNEQESTDTATSTDTTTSADEGSTQQDSGDDTATSTQTSDTESSGESSGTSATTTDTTTDTGDSGTTDTATTTATTTESGT